VVLAVPLHVLRDVEAVEPRLAVAHLRVRLLQRRLPGAEGLHLRPREHEPGLDPVEEVVLVPRAAVVDDQLLSLLPGHGAQV